MEHIYTGPSRADLDALFEEVNACEMKHAGEDAAEAAENERARDAAPKLLVACRTALSTCELGGCSPHDKLSHIADLLRDAIQLVERGRCSLCGLAQDIDYTLCSACRMEEL